MEDLIIYITTWNVGTKFPLESDDLQEFLGLTSTSSTYINVPDIYVIGFQEVKAQPQNILWDSLFEDPWTIRVKTLLAKFGIIKVLTFRMQGLVTSIFVKKKHLIYLRDIETLCTRRGLGGIWGNKGAISIRLGIHGCSFCFVNSHLTAHDHLLDDRIEDYKAILNGQKFLSPETSNILYHDYVFWFGDLNFRLGGSLTSDEIVEKVCNGQLPVLLKDDQLMKVMKTGDAFSELSEMDITFRPTYKYEIGLDTYDTKRKPGWPDRILYQVNANVYDKVTLNAEGLSYKCHTKYRTSDHRPVTAAFKIKVFRPTIEKMIEFHVMPTWNLGESNKVFYNVCPTLETSPEDWIAIYKSDFSSLDDYVAYTYLAPNNPENAEELTGNDARENFVLFTENSILIAGVYVLVYFSHPPKCIYAMSNPFEVIVPISQN
jgi:inositol-1,4,5-trisphosphate 5-phosphatase